MDDPRVLRIITVGLVLAALAVVYFLFTGTFSVGKPKVAQNQTNKAAQAPTPTPATRPSAPQVIGQAQPTAIPATSSAAVANNPTSGTQNGVASLPSTGFPAGLAVVFSISAVVTGFSLRRFPK